MSRSLGALAVVCALSGSAFAEARRDLTIPEPTVPGQVPATGMPPYNTIFLNRCVGNCSLSPGTTDSRTNRSSLVGASTQLSAFKGTDAQWQKIVECVKDTFSVFNVNVTDVDPGTAPHFEIMIAGYGQELQNQQITAQVYGVSPRSCSSYLDEAIVFVFANQFIDNPGAFGPNSNEEEMCSTAAQELAHAFALDHTIVKSDPMTYNLYVGRRYFAQGDVQCGSDCVNGRSPTGQTCSGQSHACSCTNQQTQNEIAILTGLFGAGPGTPPTVTISDPPAGATVMAGFPVTVTAVDNGPQPMAKVELRIDGTLVDTKTAAPYTFMAPITLAVGPHTLEATAYDQELTPGKATTNIKLGPPCTSDSECTKAGDVCAGGRCVAGPSVTGGLGSPCTMNSDCVSQSCGSDGTNSYCVEPCTTGTCPSGFGCLLSSATAGECWPGFNDGGKPSGGCAVAPGGAISSGLLFAALVFARRRRRQ